MLALRRYQPEDAPAVWRLHQAALQEAGAYFYSGAWEDDLHHIEAVYLDSGGEFLVGLYEQQIVAMGALLPLSEVRAEIKRMRVHPAFQRRGFGQTLLRALEERARACGLLHLSLDTTILQTAAQRLYLANDYTEVQRATQEEVEFLFYEKTLC